LGGNQFRVHVPTGCVIGRSHQHRDIWEGAAGKSKRFARIARWVERAPYDWGCDDVPRQYPDRRVPVPFLTDIEAKMAARKRCEAMFRGEPVKTNATIMVDGKPVGECQVMVQPTLQTEGDLSEYVTNGVSGELRLTLSQREAADFRDAILKAFDPHSPPVKKWLEDMKKTWEPVGNAFARDLDDLSRWTDESPNPEPNP
jgi:hypothetical protein